MFGELIVIYLAVGGVFLAQGMFRGTIRPTAYDDAYLRAAVAIAAIVAWPSLVAVGLIGLVVEWNERRRWRLRQKRRRSVKFASDEAVEKSMKRVTRSHRELIESLGRKDSEAASQRHRPS